MFSTPTAASSAEFMENEDAFQKKEFGHWVEKVFAPSVNLTLDNLFTTGDGQSTQQPTEPLQEIYSRLLKYSGTTDNYYDQDSIPGDGAISVRTNCEKFVSTKEAQENNRPRTKTMRSVKTQFPSSRRRKILEMRPEEQSCLWNKEEMGFLRDHYKTVHAKNEFLKNELDVLKKEYEKMMQKFEEERLDWKQKSHLLTETLKSNKQMTISIDHLTRNNAELTETTIQQAEELKQLRDENYSTEKKLSHVRKELHEEKWKGVRLENVVSTIENEAILKWELKEMKLQQNFQSQIEKLDETVQNLSEELEKEQKSHAHTEKALNHLRNHFACQAVNLHEYQHTKLHKINLIQ